MLSHLLGCHRARHGAPNRAPAPSGLPESRSRRGRATCPLVCLLLGLALAADAFADEAAGRGSWVLVLSSRTPVWLDGRVRAILNAGSVFRVEHAEDQRIWFEAGSVRGWVRSADVLPLDRSIEHLAAATRRRPREAAGWIGLGIARLALHDPEGAYRDLSEAIRLAPDDPWAFHNRSAANHARRDYVAALIDADVAIRLNPDEPAHHANRASARFALGNYRSAAGDYTRALELLEGGEASIEYPESGAPGTERARLWSVRWTCARAECWEALAFSSRAVSDLGDALKLDPGDSATINALAWTLATCRDPEVRDGRRAFELAARACDLTGYRDHACLGTLAAAFLELGDRMGAMKWLRRALELASGDSPREAEYRRRLGALEADPPRADGPSPRSSRQR